MKSNNKADPTLLAAAITLAIIFALAATIGVPRAHAQQSPQQTFRDASGRTIGTATQNGNQTTFRDSRGATTGTATTDRSGNTVYRDPSGRTTGTSSSPFNGRR